MNQCDSEILTCILSQKKDAEALFKSVEQLTNAEFDRVKALLDEIEHPPTLCASLDDSPAIA